MQLLGATTKPGELEATSREAVEDGSQLLGAVLSVRGARTVENTLLPLDEIQRRIGDLWNVVALLRSVHPDAAVRGAAERCEAVIDSFWNDVCLNPTLYDAVRSLKTASLDPVSRRLVTHLTRDFHRAGVDRDGATRERVRALRRELVSVGQEFLRNIVSDVRGIVVDGPGDLEGLPEDCVEQHPPGPDGKIRITTDYPDYNPFMTYARRGDLRKQLYSEFRRRAYPRNLEVLDRLLLTRHELSNLLGYPSWAAYATEDKMVKSPEAISGFLDRVSGLARSRAADEYEWLLEEKRRDSPEATAVHDWEKGYYERRVRLRRFDVDAKEVRRYFEYPRVRSGILSLTEDLFGVKFVPAPSAPRWHPDVEVLDVLEGSERIGRVYLDMHPRDGKFKHAALFPLCKGGGRHVPEAALVCNFPDPRKYRGPALLEHEDVITFFHEFGHLLHHLFARGSEWVKFSGLSTEWDFVEVPSQLLEEWAWDHEALRRFAVHCSTGKHIPRELVAEMRRARDFGQALAACHQVFYAALSLRCHLDDPRTLETNRLVVELQNHYSFFRFVEDTYFHASFGHLDDYSALYYTYLWSLVIEKDILGEFAKGGLMEARTARRFREAVLAPGGTQDAADLVRAFLGRDYSFDAFQRWLAGESRAARER